MPLTNPPTGMRVYDMFPKIAGIPTGNTVSSALVLNPETAFAWSSTIAGNDLVAGSTIDFECAGIISTSVVSLPLTVRVKVNGNTIATAAFTPLLNLANRGWTLSLRGVIQDSSTIEIQGQGDFAGTVVDLRNTAPYTIDPSLPMITTVTAQWGALALGGSIQLRQWILQVS